jgi:hypothetical protein
MQGKFILEGAGLPEKPSIETLSKLEKDRNYESEYS